jgi:hypothetical protein
MGLAKLVYIILAVAAAFGFIGFVYSKLGKRPSIGPAMLIMFVLGALGIVFWGIFLTGLNDTLAEAIEDGQSAQYNLEQARLSARILHQPEPTPSDTELAAIKAMENAKRSARLFGWDWKKLEPSYRKGQPAAHATRGKHSTRTSNR